ncbi:hypothetical protein XH93_10065 [Bradyrhizobium sp. CCBAU 51753]|nr:hypothetical protein XH93_10065 [Bradyrhizobium sp. CCBAU 51753]
MHFQTYLNAFEQDATRKTLIEEQIRELIEGFPWAKPMQALQAPKGSGPTVAARMLTEVGYFSRFADPRNSSPTSALLHVSTAAAAP